MALSLNLALLGVLVVLSGMFSGSETVLFALTPAQLQQQAASGNPLRRLAARLMERPKQTLTVILVGNTAVNILLFATSYLVFGELADRLGAWVRPAAGVASVMVVVVFGEVVPKVLGVTLTQRLAPLAALVVHAGGYVLRPAGWLLDRLAVEPLSRLLFGHTSTRRPVSRKLSADELKALLELSSRRGLINPVEVSYLREIIDLRRVRVRDIMVPRVEVQVFDVEGDPEQLRALMRRTHLTKVPVYEDSVDNIVGLIYAKVLFFERKKSLRELLSPVRFVPELITVEQLLMHFRDTRSQLAIAVDEYGGMAGLVTLEDALEEIVGEIYDPEDQRGEEPIVQLGESEYEISGRLPVHEWLETFGLADVPERVATVGGLVTARLGRPAQPGDIVLIGNVRLEVTRVSRHRVQRLRLSLIGGGQEGGETA